MFAYTLTNGDCLRRELPAATLESGASKLRQFTLSRSLEWAYDDASVLQRDVHDHWHSESFRVQIQIRIRIFSSCKCFASRRFRNMFFAFELYYRLVQVVDYKETQASVPSCHDIPRCVASKFTSFLCISPEHHHNAFPIYDRCYFLQPKDERQQSQRLWLGMYWRQRLLKSAAPRKTAPNGILDYFAASKSFSNRCFHRCPTNIDPRRARWYWVSFLFLLFCAADRI